MPGFLRKVLAVQLLSLHNNCDRIEERAHVLCAEQKFLEWLHMHISLMFIISNVHISGIESALEGY